MWKWVELIPVSKFFQSICLVSSTNHILLCSTSLCTINERKCGRNEYIVSYIPLFDPLFCLCLGCTIAPPVPRDRSQPIGALSTLANRCPDSLCTARGFHVLYNAERTLRPFLRWKISMKRWWNQHDVGTISWMTAPLRKSSRKLAICFLHPAFTSNRICSRGNFSISMSMANTSNTNCAIW